MEFSNSVIIILCVIAFIFPFVLIGRKGRKKKKALKMSLRDYAVKHNFQIDEFEVADGLALGIDHKNNIAFFSEALENGSNITHVVLNDIQSCKMSRQTRDVNTTFGRESLLSKLELSFYPKIKTGDVISFVLFDESKDKRLGDELPLGNKWAEIYNGKRK